MFEHVSPEMLQRAMNPSVSYGHNNLATMLHNSMSSFHAHTSIILTQSEPWAIARQQFADIDEKRVFYLHSMEYDEVIAMERALPATDIMMGIGGGQAMDAAKFVAWRRGIPLVLAPTIVSVDAAITNTIAIREGKRVRYIGFVVADAVVVDLAVIKQAPIALNRAGIGDLLSIHTALWDWKHTGHDYDAAVAEEVVTILDGLEKRIEAVANCTDEALRYIMQSYVHENALCLRVGSSSPEEGSEHFLGYNIEYLTGRGYVHGQLICLCTYAMARLQENRPEWVHTLIERVRCPWRLSELHITRDEFIRALVTLGDYVMQEKLPASVITQRPITVAFAEQLARECGG